MLHYTQFKIANILQIENLHGLKILQKAHTRSIILVLMKV